LKACSASTFDFDNSIRKVKSLALGRSLYGPFRGAIFHFRNSAALAANQKLNRMGMVGIGASDKRI
jgi:hypothetical protein